MAELIGQGPIALPGGTSVVFTTPYPLKPGARARDLAGNEYLFVDFVGSVSAAQPVSIKSDFTASPLTVAERGPVGIALQIGTSDNAGWVQIYGRCYMQITGDADHVSPSNGAALTTLSTSAQTVFYLPTSLTSPPTFAYTNKSTEPSVEEEIWLEGCCIATDASIDGTVTLVSHTTSGTTLYRQHTGNMVAVFINYPTLQYHNYGTSG